MVSEIMWRIKSLFLLKKKQEKRLWLLDVCVLTCKMEADAPFQTSSQACDVSWYDNSPISCPPHFPRGHSEGWPSAYSDLPLSQRDGEPLFCFVQALLLAWIVIIFILCSTKYFKAELKYHWFSLLIIVMFYKVTMNSERMKTEPVLLTEIYG